MVLDKTQAAYCTDARVIIGDRMNNSLMANGSSLLEQRAAAACASISELSVPLRDLWNPWKCPAGFLPYLAWAFSVDSWDESWSEQEKRTVISESFRLHQRKGTIEAIRRVVEKWVIPSRSRSGGKWLTRREHFDLR